MVLVLLSRDLHVVSLLDTLDDDDEVLWALAEQVRVFVCLYACHYHVPSQLGEKDFVVLVGGPEWAHTLLVSEREGIQHQSYPVSLLASFGESCHCRGDYSEGQGC